LSPLHLPGGQMNISSEPGVDRLVQVFETPAADRILGLLLTSKRKLKWQNFPMVFSANFPAK
jgi:hypothetical protein